VVGGNVLKIAFIHDWDVHYQQELDWQDGLAAALHELEKRGHKVDRFVCTTGLSQYIPNPLGDIFATSFIPESVAESRPDVILHWADMTRENAVPLAELGIPMAICFAGGEVDSYNTALFDHIFVESKVYKEKLNAAGYDNVSIAFGTNTDLFSPVTQNKQFDTIFPATFAAWKRHDLYSHSVMGLRSLACGYIYTDHEQECWQECLKLGTTILPHVSAQVLKYLYAASRICVIPSMSSGGSQRTVLEAMAMNLPLIITDSDKYDYAHDSGKVFVAEPTVESIRGYIDAILDGEQEVNTRDYVLENWSHLTYADSLEQELMKLV
jgi:glycosyltransferase involved in cell wall biosynthesis